MTEGGEQQVEELDAPEDASDDVAGWLQFVAVVGALVVLGAILYGAVKLFDAIAPNDIPTRDDPNFVDNIFDSTTVIGAARVLLIVAAVLILVFAAYTVSSMVVRMKRGEWLKEGGPFKAHVEEAENYLEEAQAYYEAYAEQVGENETLLERLNEANDVITQLIEQNDDLNEKLGIQGAQSE